MNLTESVHQRFRGAMETAKQIGYSSLLLELAAATIAVIVILGTKNNWFSAIILLLTVGAAVLRAYASHVRAFALSCRKTSIRAFALQKEIDPLTESRKEVDSPPLTDWNAARLPAQTLDEYYEPSCPVGQPRLRELYAHSAFYTWTQLRIYFWMQMGVLVLIAIGAFALLYYLATNIDPNVDRMPILEAVCTVVLIVLGIRAAERAWDSRCSWWDIKRIEEALLESDEGMQDLIDEYDLTLVNTPVVPTRVYLICREKRQKQWHKRREAFHICSKGP